MSLDVATFAFRTRAQSKPCARCTCAGTHSLVGSTSSAAAHRAMAQHLQPHWGPRRQRVGEERAYPLGREFGGLRGSGHVRGTGALCSSLLGPSLVSLLPLQSLLLRSCLLSRLFRFLRFLAPAEQFSARKTGHVFREPLREPLAKRSDLLLPLPQLDVHLIEIVVNPGHLRALAGQHRSAQLGAPV